MFDSYALKRSLEDTFQFKLNKNQAREIERLFFDIMRRDQCQASAIIENLKTCARSIEKYSAGTRYIPLKEILIKERFPLSSSRHKIDPADVFLNPVPKPLSYSCEPVYPFYPEKIVIEKQVEHSPLVYRVKKMFPSVERVSIDHYSLYIRENPFRIEEFKRPILFLTKQEGDFIKKCPCTKAHTGCGYYIFNLGFGCPFDCSYCYLQQYTNAPGIVLPANIDDFFTECADLLRRLNRPVRIGTGEFCDSLALDPITGYAAELISFFRNKNCFFELKTKSTAINAALSAPGSPQVVLSWSLNTPKHIQAEEKRVASLEERLSAAHAIQQKGYGIAFHFDPIIYTAEWEKEYRAVVEQLYQQCSGPFAWISLGTLRSQRVLKTIAEQRFPTSTIFYGELFLGKDKKLRYPVFLRSAIYKKMIEWIRAYDTMTPIYLCMEDDVVWQEVFGQAKTTMQVEAYIRDANQQRIRHVI